MAERRWVGPASWLVLVLLVTTTVAAVLVSQQQLETRLETLAASAVESVRHDVQLNIQRDVAAAVGLARSLDDVTTLDAGRWTTAVEQVANAGVFAELGAANLFVVTTTEDLEATVADLPGDVRDALDLRLADAPLHGIGIAVWPEEPNAAVLGYDLMLNPVASTAARSVIRSNTVRSTRPVEVVQETEEQRSTIVYVPVADESGTVTGLISLVFRAGSLLEDAVERLPRGAHVRWTDRSPGLDGDDALLAWTGDRVEDGATAAVVFADLGRSFRVEVTLPRSALSATERRAPFLVGALGVLLTVGSVVIAAAWRRTTDRADQLAERRTAALAATTAELEVANRELVELDRLKDRMLGTVSHDLRSPLTVIRGAAQVLIERPTLSDESRQELLHRLLRQTSRLRGLIDELLVSAQVRGGMLQADTRPVPLRPLVGTILDDLGVGELARDPDLQPVVLADPIHVERILHNLVMNAVNHGAPPVEVTIRIADDAAEVEVRDHGDGVPAELRDRVFTKFGRTGDAGPGYGLGLAIATELARVNGGTLRYRELAEPGARFVLTLPLA